MFAFAARRVAHRALARRTFFATPPSPAKAAAAETKTATKPPAKRGRPKITPAKPKEKEEKPMVRVPQKLRPPKRAPGPYLIFFLSYIKSQPKAATLQDIQELTKRAGQVWRNYTIAEKQPFYDESEARRVQAKQAREEFFNNTSISDLKKLNAIRKAQGKPKYHFAKKDPLPVTPFILFSNEFRNTPDGKALIEKTSPEKRYPIRAVVAAGSRWRSMSDEEKAPYHERFRQAKALQAEQ